LELLIESQAVVSVVLLVIASSFVCAFVAIVLMASIFVWLFLALSARAVSLPARVMSFWRDFMLSHSSSVLAAASMTAQVDTRVVLEDMVVSLVEASDALDWMSAILVALLLVLSASLVVLDASLTSWFREDISLQRLLSVTALVLVLFLSPLATTAVASTREKKRLENCMLSVEGYWEYMKCL